MFNWTLRAQEAFKLLKKRFTEALVLATFDLEKKIVIEIDVLDFAIRAYLGQLDKQRKLRPVAYYSKKMSPTELNYNVYDKELLAIVIAFE